MIRVLSGGPYTVAGCLVMLSDGPKT
ncbi:hypothetical protein LINPERPRIM_LOCUS16829 [Linum perenne]